MDDLVYLQKTNFKTNLAGCRNIAGELKKGYSPLTGLKKSLAARSERSMFLAADRQTSTSAACQWWRQLLRFKGGNRLPCNDDSAFHLYIFSCKNASCECLDSCLVNCALQHLFLVVRSVPNTTQILPGARINIDGVERSDGPPLVLCAAPEYAMYSGCERIDDAPNIAAKVWLRSVNHWHSDGHHKQALILICDLQ